MDAVEFVTSRIVARYGHPARKAYLYLFRLTPGSDFDRTPPDPSSIIGAWLDEGDQLAPAAPKDAIARCQSAYSALHASSDRRPETRRLMARIVVFSVEEHEPGMMVVVQLSSRALAFTPKGDRRVTETWRPAQDGTDGWYSAHPDSTM